MAYRNLTFGIGRGLAQADSSRCAGLFQQYRREADMAAMGPGADRQLLKGTRLKRLFRIALRQPLRCSLPLPMPFRQAAGVRMLEMLAPARRRSLKKTVINTAG